MTPDQIPALSDTGAADGAKGQGLTHIDASGSARMVDVGEKPVSRRVAVAGGFIEMKPSTLAMIESGEAPKGDVMATARIAGIMAAKQTSSLIPLCHPLSITHASVVLEPEHEIEGDTSRAGVRIRATVATDGKTGVEMEALTAASVAALTLYDMCKAVDRGMVVRDVLLYSKEGGASGTWIREESAE